MIITIKLISNVNNSLENNQANPKNQAKKKHLQTIFNRGPNNSGGEKKLYQQKEQTHADIKQNTY